MLPAPRRIGLISDTHGLLRPGVLQCFVGCDRIIHGGDIGGEHILQELRTVAPVTAVRGNNDTEPWALSLPVEARLSVDGIAIHVVHDIGEISIDPQASGVGVVVHGHSHKPLIDRRQGVLFVNPGSAGPRRFRLPTALAELRIDASGVTAVTHELR